MSYIRAVLPLKDCRLFLEMESGSTATVDLSGRLHTVKYAQLADRSFFRTASADGDYVVWGGGRLRLTVNELMEVMLLG